MESSKTLLSPMGSLKNTAKLHCERVLNEICQQSAKFVLGKTVFVCNLCADQTSTETFSGFTDMQLHVFDKHIAAFFLPEKPKEMLKVDFQVFCDSIIEHEISKVTNCNTPQNVLCCSLCSFRCLDLDSKRNQALMKMHMIINHYYHFTNKISKSLQSPQQYVGLQQKEFSVHITTSKPNSDRAILETQQNENDLKASNFEQTGECAVNQTGILNAITTTGSAFLSTSPTVTEQSNTRSIASSTQQPIRISSESDHNELNCHVCLKLEKPEVFQDNTLLSLHLYNKHAEESFKSLKDPYFSNEEFAELCQTAIEVLCHTAEEVAKNKVGSVFLSCKFASCSKLMFSSRLVLTEHLVKEHKQSLSNSLKEIQANELKLRFPVPN